MIGQERRAVTFGLLRLPAQLLLERSVEVRDEGSEGLGEVGEVEETLERVHHGVDGRPNRVVLLVHVRLQKVQHLFPQWTNY